MCRFPHVDLLFCPIPAGRRCSVRLTGGPIEATKLNLKRALLAASHMTETHDAYPVCAFAPIIAVLEDQSRESAQTHLFEISLRNVGPVVFATAKLVILGKTHSQDSFDLYDDCVGAS